jgi:NH3-dependent NAD+ synthetase
MRNLRSTYKILVWKPEGKNLLEDLGINKRIVLKWISDRLWSELI